MDPVKHYTIKDIAMEARVSQTTVSRYLNGKYQYMSADTRERIRAIIEKYEYRPSLIARGLKRDRSYLFGVVLPFVHTSMSSHSIRGVCMACSSTPYNPIIVSIENNIENELARIQELIDHRVEGIISFTGCQNSAYKSISNMGIPIIVADRYYDKCELDGVVINHYEAVTDLLSHLYDTGYTKIAMITRKNPQVMQSTISIREKAYMDFHSEHFSDSRRLIFRLDEDDIEQIKLKLMTIKSRYPNDRIAIFATTMALLQMADWAFKILGMRYPDDMALCGYNLREDIQSTMLTTISQPLLMMGQKAFQLMIDRINGADIPFPHKIVIPADLGIRASTLTANTNNANGLVVSG